MLLRRLSRSHSALSPVHRTRFSNTLASAALLASFASSALAVQEAPADEPRPDPEGDQQQPESEDARHPLPGASETVVIATRVPEESFDVPRAVIVVDEADLRENNARTAADALEGRPGVWVQQTGALGGSPILRGFMGNRVVYLFDGVRRNTAGLFAGPNSFLQTVDALDIDRVEVILGPGSVLYGSDAIGGAINVVTNEEARFSDTVDFGGRSLWRFGSVDLEHSARGEAWVSTPDFHAFVGGTYRDFDQLRGGREVGLQEPSDWRERNFDAQFDWRVGDNSTLQFFLQDFSRPTGTRYDRPNWIQEDDRELYGARFNASDLSWADDVQATVYYQDQRGFIDEQFFDSDRQDRTIGLDLQATSSLSDSFQLTYGLHAHRDDVQAQNPQAGTVDPDVEWLNQAAFALGRWQATDRVRFDLGLRVDSFNLSSDAPAVGQLAGPIQDAITNGSFALDDLELDETDVAVTGGLGVVVGLTETVNAFAHVGRSFRAPNKSDLLSFGQFTFGFNVPSPNLRPESGWTYELGARLDEEDYSASITGFLTELDDAIVSEAGTFNGQGFVDVNGDSVADPNETVFVKSNSAGTLRAFGVEATGSLRLPEDWTEDLFGEHPVSAFGSFAWIYGEDTGSDEPLDRAYPANALIGLRVDDSANPRESDWWVQLDSWIVRDFGRIPSDRQTSDPAFFNDPQDSSSGLLGGDGEVPGFTLFNLRGGFRVNQHATLTLAAENLLDEAFRVKDSRIDGPGMNFAIGLEMRF